MGDRLRFAILGAGMMGREHIRNLLLLPDVEITALVEPDEGSLALARATLQGAPEPALYQDAAALAAAGAADAVIVASPNHTHRAVLEPLFASPLHILCEKPLCARLTDARWAADRARAHPGVFWTGMEYRFMPPMARFVEQVWAGRVGRVWMLSLREHRFPFLPKVGDWNRFARNTGGTMVEKCCHFFDLMRLILQDEPIRVFCSGAMDVNHLEERYDGRRPDILDNSYTIVEFAGGARAMLDLCMFAEGAANQEEACAVGDKARLEVFIPDGDIVFSPRTGFQPKAVTREHVGVDAGVLAAGTHHGATFYQLRHFIAAVRGEGPVLVTAEDGLRAVAMGAAAEQSAHERRAVAMSELGF